MGSDPVIAKAKGKSRHQQETATKAERRKALIMEFRKEYVKSGGKLLSDDEIIRMVRLGRGESLDDAEDLS